jgi:uncharacterized protein YcbX
MTATITGLFSYPIKSCAPIVLNSTFCTTQGLPHDREYLIASASGDKIFTQRDLPIMSLLQPRLSAQNELLLRGTDEREITIPAHQKGEVLTVNVWGNEYQGIDQGEEISQWLSDQLAVDCRLFKRFSGNGAAPNHGKDNTRYDASFVDCCPLSVIFEEELHELNGRLDEPVRANRFRPSIVIKGVPREEHDRIKVLRTENLSLTYIRPIGRCVIVNIDQEAGKVASSECLKVLAGYRMLNQKAIFGYYFVAPESGRISVGDSIITA